MEYVIGVDSLPQEGVPKGTVEKRTWNESRIYPGTTRDYWVYVPAQYDEAKPACVMVFQDGADFILLEGEVRVPTVFDNLIHKGEIPVTIGIFMNPGRKDPGFSNRDEEYLPLNDIYARFLLEEILPEVGKDYNLVDDAAGRAVCGMSDGGVGSLRSPGNAPMPSVRPSATLAATYGFPVGPSIPISYARPAEAQNPYACLFRTPRITSTLSKAIGRSAISRWSPRCCLPVMTIASKWALVGTI